MTRILERTNISAALEITNAERKALREWRDSLRGTLIGGKYRDFCGICERPILVGRENVGRGLSCDDCAKRSGNVGKPDGGLHYVEGDAGPWGENAIRELEAAR